MKEGNHPHTNMVSKAAFMRRGEQKCRRLDMYMKLSDQQLKTILFIYRLLHQNLKATTNQKFTTDTCTKMKTQSNHNTDTSHQVTREQRRKGRKKTYENKLRIINKMATRIYILIITLNGNRLYVPTKTQRPAGWIQKQDSYICCLQETHFRPRDTYRLQVRGWKKVFHGNQN